MSGKDIFKEPLPLGMGRKGSFVHWSTQRKDTVFASKIFVHRAMSGLSILTRSSL